MAKRILAASDLSEASNEGILQAHARARATGARLGICHVLERASARGTLEVADVEGEARRAIASQLAACGPGATAEIFIDSGTPHRAIVDRADAWSADLLVVASRGRSIAPRGSIGSVAEQVARNARCPVLVARESPARGVVLAATDFSDPSMPAIAAAAAEARLREARLVVLHAVAFGSVSVTIEEIVRDLTRSGDEGTWNLDAEICRDLGAKLERALAESNAEGEARVVDGTADDAILRSAAEVGAELIVVGTRGRTGIVRIALGSTADRVLAHASCSVLAVRLDPRAPARRALAQPLPTAMRLSR
jgi:universal stress protein E